MTKDLIMNGEHDMNYCEDDNCKHYGNKEQCEKTHCYYRSYSKLYTAHKRKEQECEELKKEIAFGNNGTLSDKIRAKVFKELNNENNQLKAENEELKKKIKYMEEYIKTVENSRNEFEKESKFLKEEIQKL